MYLLKQFQRRMTDNRYNCAFFGYIDRRNERWLLNKISVNDVKFVYWLIKNFLLCRYKPGLLKSDTGRQFQIPTQTTIGYFTSEPFVMRKIDHLYRLWLIRRYGFYSKLSVGRFLITVNIQSLPVVIGSRNMLKFTASFIFGHYARWKSRNIF